MGLSYRNTNVTLHDRSEFGVDWHSSFSSGEVQNLPFPIRTTSGLYHCRATALARVVIHVFHSVEKLEVYNTSEDPISHLENCKKILFT